MNHDSEHDQLLRELNEIERVIEDLTPLRSNWNGTLQLESIEGERGSKSFQWDITLRPGMAATPLRWRNLIARNVSCLLRRVLYTGLHGVSRLGRRRSRAVVTVYRKPIMERLEIEAYWEAVDAPDHAHPFNKYITALEAIRAAFAANEPEFYVNLLQTPLRDRHASLIQGALLLEEAQRRRVIAVLSASRPVLEKRVP